MWRYREGVSLCVCLCAGLCCSTKAVGTPKSQHTHTQPQSPNGERLIIQCRIKCIRWNGAHTACCRWPSCMQRAANNSSSHQTEQFINSRDSFVSFVCVCVHVGDREKRFPAVSVSVCIDVDGVTHMCCHVRTHNSLNVFQDHGIMYVAYMPANIAAYTLHIYTYLLGYSFSMQRE